MWLRKRNSKHKKEGKQGRIDLSEKIRGERWGTARWRGGKNKKPSLDEGNLGEDLLVNNGWGEKKGNWASLGVGCDTKREE